MLPDHHRAAGLSGSLCPTGRSASSTRPTLRHLQSLPPKTAAIVFVICCSSVATPKRTRHRLYLRLVIFVSCSHVPTKQQQQQQQQQQRQRCSSSSAVVAAPNGSDCLRHLLQFGGDSDPNSSSAVAPKPPIADYLRQLQSCANQMAAPAAAAAMLFVICSRCLSSDSSSAVAIGAPPCNSTVGHPT